MVGVSPSNDAAGLQNEVRALDILDSVLSQAQDGHEVGDATVPPFLGSVLSQAIGQRCSDANAMALRGPHQLSTPMDTQNINDLHVESSDSITTGNITVFHQPVTLNTAAPVRFGQGKVSHNESKERIRTDVAAPPKLASRGCRRFMRWPWVLVPTAVVAVLIAVITVVVLVSGSTTSAETTTWGPTSTATDWTKTPTNQTDTSTTPADQTDPTTVATVTDPSPGTSTVTTTITTTTEVCGKNMFLCKNGNCIDIMKKCSGTDNCGDGSDEDPLLCDVPMRNITVGTKVMARLEYRPEHEAVWILMCGSDSCSRLVVQGYSSLDGSLAYDSYTNCTLKGQNCLAGGSGSPGQMVPFSAGNVSFFVTHSDTQGLKVALRMHEDYATSVVAPADSKHLWIRPQLWYFDMPTTYYDSCNDTSDFQCNDGQCINGQLVCAGTADIGCSDSLNLDPAICNKHAINVTVGQTVRAIAHFDYDRHGSNMIFDMCDDYVCSNIIVDGYWKAHDNHLLWYFASTKSCNSLGQDCALPDNFNDCPTYPPDSCFMWSTGVYTFEILRNEHNRLFVWLIDPVGPKTKRLESFVDVSDDAFLLRVRPHFWDQDMPVQFVTKN